MRKRALVVRASLLLLLGAPVSALADDLVWVTGRVFDEDGARPVAEAIVAVYDEKSEVVDYATTDADGNYTLAVPRKVMRLGGKGAGFAHQATGGAAGVLGSLAGVLKAGVKVAAAAGGKDPKVGVASGVAQNVLNRMQGSKDKAEFVIPPATMIMKVTRPGRKDAVSLASAYWVEQTLLRAGRKERRVLTAWVDPVRLTAAGSTGASTVGSTYLIFTDARLEPSIAQAGQTVSLLVELPSPPEPRTPLLVVARNAKTGKTVELLPDGASRYRAELQIDKSYPRNDQTIAIVAYPQQPAEPGRSKKVEDAIQRAGLWDPVKPYAYDPLLVASRNRAEVVLTVVEPPRRHRSSR